MLVPCTGAPLNLLMLQQSSVHDGSKRKMALISEVWGCFVSVKWCGFCTVFYRNLKFLSNSSIFPLGGYLPSTLQSVGCSGEEAYICIVYNLFIITALAEMCTNNRSMKADWFFSWSLLCLPLMQHKIRFSFYVEALKWTGLPFKSVR